MGAREDLARIPNILESIERKREIIERLRDSAESVPTFRIKADAVQTSPSGSSFERMIAEAADVSAELADEVADLIAELRKVDAVLDRMPAKYARILRGVYIEGKKLYEIADDVAAPHSYGYTRHLHAEALEIYEEEAMKNDKRRSKRKKNEDLHFRKDH